MKKFGITLLVSVIMDVIGTLIGVAAIAHNSISLLMLNYILVYGSYIGYFISLIMIIVIAITWKKD